MFKSTRFCLISLLCLAPLPALAVPSVNFIIDGDTFTSPFSFGNNSNAGEEITAFQIDLSGTGLVFDPVNGGPPGNGSTGVPFTPVGGTDLLTGLTSSSVVDGGTVFDLTFNDFQVGEVFAFDLDVDPSDPTASATVFGNQMIGATAFINFSDGQQLTGIFAAVVGNDDASAFTATGLAPIPPVPLPAPALLTLSALGTLGAVRLRRRKRVAR